VDYETENLIIIKGVHPERLLNELPKKKTLEKTPMLSIDEHPTFGSIHKR
jgi:hypothetical protein